MSKKSLKLSCGLFFEIHKKTHDIKLMCVASFCIMNFIHGHMSFQTFTEVCTCILNTMQLMLNICLKSHAIHLCSTLSNKVNIKFMAKCFKYMSIDNYLSQNVYDSNIILVFVLMKTYINKLLHATFFVECKMPAIT